MKRRRRLSTRQWAKTLLFTAALVIVFILSIRQLTEAPDHWTTEINKEDPETVSQITEGVEVEPAQVEAEQAGQEETEAIDQKKVEPVEQTKSEPIEEKEMETVEQPKTEPPEQRQAEPVEQAESESTEETATELRNRLEARTAKLDDALTSMEARLEDQSNPVANMAMSMIDNIDARDRVEEAVADLKVADSRQVTDTLLTVLKNDEEQQAGVAGLLEKEFETLKENMEEVPPLPPSHAGRSRLGEMLVEHRVEDVMSVEESQQILTAVGEDKAVYIRSLRWNGQAKATRDLWIGMGGTYALLPPRGSFEPIYRVRGELENGHALEAMDQDSFFSRFSNRFTYVTTGEGERGVREIEARLLRKCGQCGGYKLSLVWNWETLALILSDARALAHEKDIRFPEDVKIIEWLAIPGSRAERARVDVIRLIGRNGEIYEF